MKGWSKIEIKRGLVTIRYPYIFIILEHISHYKKIRVKTPTFLYIRIFIQSDILAIEKFGRICLECLSPGDIPSAYRKLKFI